MKEILSNEGRNTMFYSKNLDCTNIIPSIYVERGIVSINSANDDRNVAQT